MLDKLAFCGFRLTLPEIFESENRHVYFSTCLIVIPCSVDITDFAGAIELALDTIN